MFRIRPVFLAALVAITALLAVAAAPVLGVTTVLVDSIGPGVLRGNDGFGTSTVLVAKDGYVTYLVRTDSRLKGKSVQIWTDTGQGWKLLTTRTIDADGAVHYFARITTRTGFWAKYTGVKPSVTSHGRSAALSSDGTTTILIACGELGPTGSAVKSIVSRSVATRLGGTVRVIVCSRPSTGFSWGMVSLDSTRLLRVGHVTRADRPPDADGSEMWSVRVTRAGVGRATFVYSQPWRGGEKAVWTLILTVQT